MNRSYSKIRHIQESNMILEGRRKSLLNENVSAAAAQLMAKVKNKCPKSDAVVKGCIETLTNGEVKELFKALLSAGIGIWNFVSGLAGSPFTFGVSLLQTVLGAGLITTSAVRFSKIDYSALYNDIVKIYNCAKRKINELIKTNPSYDESQNRHDGGHYDDDYDIDFCLH